MNNGRHEDENGNVEWFKDDVYHREDGPAIEYFHGSKKWYKNGKLHREDGPAIEWDYLQKEWYINDIEYSEEEFNHWLEKKQLNEKLQATLQPKPTQKRSKI